MTAVPHDLRRATPSYASSSEGRFSQRQMVLAVEKLQESNSLGHPSLHADLDSLARECAFANWDGYDAAPVSLASIQAARRLLNETPPAAKGVSLSVGAEPDGHATVEWHKAPSWTLSVSLSPTGDLHYAALHGAGVTYGTEHFEGDGRLPERIRDLIITIERA